MKKFGIATILTLVMLLTACGENVEIKSQNSTSMQNSLTAQSSSILSGASSAAANNSQTSSLTEGLSAESSSVSEQPKPEKILLTEDELKKYYMEKYYCLLENFSQSDTEHKLIDAKFDISEFIYSGDIRTFELLATWCDGFGVAPDRTETKTVWYDDPSDTWEEPVYIYSAKTAEKIIRKIIPDFDINRVDYKKWYSWDDEKNAFSAGQGAGDGGWIYSLQYKVESGYKLGDEVYINVSVDDRDQLEKKLSQVSRDELKEMRYRRLKQFRIKDDGLMSVENIDESLEEWRETAMNIFEMMQNDDVLAPEMDGSKGVCVMDGDIGKRICYSFQSQMGSHRTMQNTLVYTYGTRGKGDVITFSRSSGSAINYTAMKPQEMWEESYGDCTVEDKLKGEKYAHSYDKFEYPDGYTGTHFDEKPDTYKHNDKEISEDEYNSAELVKYFKHFQGLTSSEENIIYTCKNGTNLTVAEFYEMCRILYE